MNTANASPTLGALANSMAPFFSAMAAQLQQVSHLCDYCKAQPKHVDGTRTHPYCSKTCATNAAKQNLIAPASTPTQTQSSNCVVCNANPQYNDGTTTHLYCSKSCASKAKHAPTAKRRMIGFVKPAVPKATAPLCTVPGCKKTAYKDSTGASDFCSRSHKKLAAEACLQCQKAPKRVGHFCTHTCANNAHKKGPALLEVPENHNTFKSVADQFKRSWRDTSRACPPVRRVYKIISTQVSLDKYEAYRDSVERRGQFKALGRSPGNENRRWHGTKRQCNLGDKGQSQFCASPLCSLCAIVRTSFDLGKISHTLNFGQGIYTSSTSSMSDGYSRNTSQSTLKAILLNKVVVGKGFKLSQVNNNLTAPPAGYDSVLAEAGAVINNDELVVFSNDAIRPSYLVMYEP